MLAARCPAPGPVPGPVPGALRPSRRRGSPFSPAPRPAAAHIPSLLHPTSWRTHVAGASTWGRRLLRGATTAPPCRAAYSSGGTKNEDMASVSSPASVPPDLWAGGELLPQREGRAQVFAAGVEHSASRPDVAELILRARPSVVVVETGVSREHEAATGAVFEYDERNLQRGRSAEGFFLAMYTNIAKQLREGAGEGTPPWEDPSWAQVAAAMSGEQLAYVAALAVGAQVVYGDRPKARTLERLLEIPTLEEADEAFAAHALYNYQELLEGGSCLAAAEAARGGDVDAYTRIVVQERDVVLAASIQGAAEAAGPGELVVAIVGEAHLPGLRNLFANGGVDVGAAEALLAPPPPRPDTELRRAVKRAIVERTLALTCRPEVAAALGPPEDMPEEIFEAYDFTLQVYSSNRMLLAGLPKERLGDVISPLPGGPGMWEVLAPLRALRPCNGGPGYGREAIEELLKLSFMIGGAEEPETGTVPGVV